MLAAVPAEAEHDDRDRPGDGDRGERGEQWVDVVGAEQVLCGQVQDLHHVDGHHYQDNAHYVVIGGAQWDGLADADDDPGGEI